MKKNKYKKLISIILVTVLSTLCFTGCNPLKNKKETTVEKFTDVLKEMGYDVQDATDQLEGAEEIESVTIALNEDYQIELYIFKSAKEAKEGYSNIKKTFDDEIANSSKSLKKSASLKNYSYYKVTTDDTYYVDYRYRKNTNLCR